jgi:hypothetical protein
MRDGHCAPPAGARSRRASTTPWAAAIGCSAAMAGQYWSYPKLLRVVRVWERYLTTRGSIEAWQVTT